MTHEELLAVIDKHFQGRCSLRCLEHMPWHALRAVVELHSPFDNLAGEFCTICTAMEDKDIYTLYPCPTIQAIEKELNA